MSNRRTVSFYIVVCICLIYSSLSLSQPQTQPLKPIVSLKSESTSDSLATQNDRKLLVYFFHGRKRRMSCRTIEAYAHDALQTYFKELLQNGRIEWLDRNYANPEYAHFKDDFQLY